MCIKVMKREVIMMMMMMMKRKKWTMIKMMKSLRQVVIIKETILNRADHQNQNRECKQDSNQPPKQITILCISK